MSRTAPLVAGHVYVAAVDKPILLTDGMLRDGLAEAGWSEITIADSPPAGVELRAGGNRWVTAKWARASTEQNVPDQVIDLVDVTPATDEAEPDKPKPLQVTPAVRKSIVAAAPKSNVPAYVGLGICLATLAAAGGAYWYWNKKRKKRKRRRD